MSFDDRVLALFGEANPVSTEATLDELTRPRLALIEQGEEHVSDAKDGIVQLDRPIVKQERNRGLLVGLAAAVLALLIGTASWIALAGSPDKTREEAAADGDPIAVIEVFFERWSAGDVRGAMSFIGDQDWTEGNPFIGQSMEYVVALEPEGWFWSVSDCAEQVADTYRCRIELVGDPLLDAVGGSAGQNQFKVEDGKITGAPRILGIGAAQADQALAQYARQQDPAGYEAACVGANGRAWEANGVVFNRACGAFLAPYVQPAADELTGG